jgi:hypothetical protein
MNVSAILQRVEFVGGDLKRPANAVLRGDAPCSVCKAPAHWRCDWPVQRKVHVPAFSIEVGDVWITQQVGKRGHVRCIEYLDINGRVRATPKTSVARRLWVAIPGHKEPFAYLRYEIDDVETVRPATCDAACCDAHARDVGEDRHYCASHWAAWETVS